MSAVHPELVNDSNLSGTTKKEKPQPTAAREKYSSSILFSCCCPCLVLNALPQSRSRDSDSGAQYVEDAMRCLFCWPVSPLMGWKVYNENKRLQEVEPDPPLLHDNKKSNFTCGECLSMLLWPCLLQRYSQQVNNKYGVPSHSPDTSHMATSHVSKDLGAAIAIAGPDKCGKTSLLVKLVGTCLDPNQQNAENNEEIHLGFKPLRVTETGVEMLDVWDLPASKLPMIRCIPKRLGCILLCFDAADEDSFNIMSDMFDALKESFPQQYIVCTALKVDVADGLVMNMAEIWARRHRLTFAEVSCNNNTGVSELLKLATAHLGPDTSLISVDDSRYTST